MAKVENKINHEIKSPEIRLVGDNVEIGLYSNREAKQVAESLGLDLVEISCNKDISICKVIDYSKFLYEKKKKEKEQKQKQKENIVETKEIRLSSNIDEHDFNFKLNFATKFLSKDKNKVKLVIQFKGREINFSELGEKVLLEFAEALSEVGVPECMPNLEGKRMSMIIKPKTKK